MKEAGLQQLLEEQQKLEKENEGKGKGGTQTATAGAGAGVNKVCALWRYLAFFSNHCLGNGVSLVLRVYVCPPFLV